MASKSTKWIVWQATKDRDRGFYSEPFRTKKAAYEFAERTVTAHFAAHVYKRVRTDLVGQLDDSGDFVLYEVIEPADVRVS